MVIDDYNQPDRWESPEYKRGIAEGRRAEQEAGVVRALEKGLRDITTELREHAKNGGHLPPGLLGRLERIATAYEQRAGFTVTWRKAVTTAGIYVGIFAAAATVLGVIWTIAHTVGTGGLAP